MQQLKTINQIILTSEGLQLYKKLVLQLNKDFHRAGIEDSFSEEISPSDLKIQLHYSVSELLQNNYSEYLNLLYIIDVSEAKIKQIVGESNQEITEQIAFLILHREWQKIWFKEKF